MTDRDRHSDAYDPEPDLDRPTLADEVGPTPERDEEWIRQQYKRAQEFDTSPLCEEDPEREGWCAYHRLNHSVESAD